MRMPSCSRIAFVFSALASLGAPTVSHALTLSSHANLEDLAGSARLPYFAAQSHHVSSAACIRKTVFTEAEMLESIRKTLPEAEGEDRLLYGIQFRNENPNLIELFRQLTTKKRSPGSPELQGPEFSSTCDDVICAVKQIFGKRVGVQLLFMLARYGYNGSHLAEANASPWTSMQLDTVLYALADFPAHLLPIDQDQRLVHFLKGYTLAAYVNNGNDGDVLANASISVFDPWNVVAPWLRRYAIFHELAHRFGAIQRLDKSPQWLRLTELGYVSEYAQESPAEDFAESVTAYRYNPRGLKRASPEKYAFIKEVIFDNLEFTSEAACNYKKSLSLRASQVASETLIMAPTSFGETPEIGQGCLHEILAYLSGQRMPFNRCVNRALKVKILGEILAQEIKMGDVSAYMLKYKRKLPEIPIPVEMQRRAENYLVTTLRTQARQVIQQMMVEDEPRSIEDCQWQGRFGYQIWTHLFENKGTILGDDLFEIGPVLNQFTKTACEEMVNVQLPVERWTGWFYVSQEEYDAVLAKMLP